MQLQVSWNPSYILLSYTLSFIGSYFGVCFSEQFRECLLVGAVVFTPRQLLLLLAFSIGGVGIWTMHFVGMGALELKESVNSRKIDVKFDFILTIISMFAAIFCVFLGLLLATSDRVYVRNAAEFGEMLAEDTKAMSIKDIRGKSKIKVMAMFKGLKPIAMGGVLAGAGVCVMHYLGMQAQTFAVRMEWNIGIIAASVLIAIVVSMVAFWIMFRLLPLFPSSEKLRVASALVMGVAVCGMHYTGMYAPTYYIVSTPPKAVSFAIGFETAVLTALLIGLICLAVVVILCLSDLRVRLRHYALALSQVQILINAHKENPVGMSSDSTAIIQRLERIFDQHYSGISSRPVNNRASSVNERYSVAPPLKRMNSASVRIQSARIHSRIHPVDAVVTTPKTNHSPMEEKKINFENFVTSKSNHSPSLGLANDQIHLANATVGKSNHGFVEERRIDDDDNGQDRVIELDTSASVAPAPRDSPMIIVPSINDVQSFRAV